MSSVGIGVAIGAGLGVGLGAGGAVTLLRRGERADLRRAERFAREQDLWLPPEIARAVGARARVRTGLGTVLSPLVGAPLLGWFFGRRVRRLGTERLQLRVLNARRPALGGPELAFDEAFRVATVLPQVLLAPVFVTLAGMVCLRTLHQGGSRVSLLFMLWTAGAACGSLVLNALVVPPSVRRYYRRRLPLSRVSETAPC
ncbi:hypothetical protein [Streptacidiphilus jiangxiensis]|uniref:Uncharacterized protein n=1 Tax=Streptacidiphilus jiangxiensis TaxID=235985 RepID=A0A1H7FEI6_STRJI|nr:hypothetical protein [Streptacidiphilus jiangxiensis]SEK24501.1 hypothetical protein SAMN05414137_101223 [Streptacidiphilus jiangxiensis]